MTAQRAITVAAPADAPEAAAARRRFFALSFLAAAMLGALAGIISTGPRL